MRILVFTAAVLATCLSFAAAAAAADITNTYSIVATDFTDLNDFGALGPIQNYDASFTVTFDPSMFTNPTTSGITTNYNTLQYYPAEFAYQPSADELAIGNGNVGSVPGQYVYVNDNPNTFFLYVVGATSTLDSPSFEIGYTTSAGDTYDSFTGAITVTPGTAGAVVPEPSIWALMISGFSAIGAAMRLRQRKVVSAV